MDLPEINPGISPITKILATGVPGRQPGKISGKEGRKNPEGDFLAGKEKKTALWGSQDDIAKRTAIQA